jgi:regulator of nucleoside diphosphate kinase
MDQMHLPEITITARNLSRLDLLPGLIVAYRTPVREALARELRRARIVSARQLPPDTVTMHSTVRYQCGATETTRTATLVYPGEEERAEGKISVLSPVGSALIGLSAGQSIDYDDIDGNEKTLTVLEVLFQPEADSRASAPRSAGRGDFEGRERALEGHFRRVSSLKSEDQ